MIWTNIFSDIQARRIFDNRGNNLSAESISGPVVASYVCVCVCVPIMWLSGCSLTCSEEDLITMALLTTKVLLRKAAQAPDSIGGRSQTSGEPFLGGLRWNYPALRDVLRMFDVLAEMWGVPEMWDVPAIWMCQMRCEVCQRCESRKMWVKEGCFSIPRSVAWFKDHKEYAADDQFDKFQ